MKFKVKGDNVSHYGKKIQPIELICKLNLDFNMGNVIKYLYRQKDKGRASALNKTLDYFYWRLCQKGDPLCSPTFLTILKHDEAHIELWGRYCKDMITDGLSWELKLIENLLILEQSYFDDEEGWDASMLTAYTKLNVYAKENYGIDLRANLIYEWLVESELVEHD